MFEKLVDIICNYVEVEPEDIRPESRFMEGSRMSSTWRSSRQRRQISVQSRKLSIILRN